MFPKQNISLDPDNLLPPDVRRNFALLVESYDHVFILNIKGYNGAAGPFEIRVNIGSLPQ